MRLLLGQLRRRSPLSNVARNSPAATSNHELASLQLQRLWAISKTDRGKLCASFAWLGTAAAQQRGRVLLLTPVMALLPPTSTAARHRGLPRRHGNFACNSLLAISNVEFVSLELQRFWALLKVQAIELHAKFGEGCVIG